MNRPARFQTTMTASAARFDAVEFAAIIDTGIFDDSKMELVDGEIQRMPPAGNDHARRQAAVMFRIATVAGESLIRVEAGVKLADDTVLAPDAVLLVSDIVGREILSPALIRLAVEIAEPTLDRDLGLKRARYAAAGIPYYWVVDGKRSIVHVFADPVDDDYETLILVPFGEPLPVPGTNRTIIIS